LPSECFMGFNHSNCSVVEGSNSVGKPEWSQKQISKAPLCAHVCSKATTINSINGDKMRVRRHLQCGAINNDVMDTAEFYTMTRQGLPHNLYGYEFRWRQKAVELDAEVVRCPLRRSACTYTDSGDLLGCQATGDDTYLKSYHVNVELKERFRNKEAFNAVDDTLVDDGDFPAKWWSVVSCDATVEEVTSEPFVITESVNFYWTPRNYVYNPLQLCLYIAASLLFFFACWTYYFAGQCIVCNRKMAFLSKKKETLDLCLVCRLLGAEMPHPEVASRLRREKAAHHNQRVMQTSFKGIKTNALKVLGIHQLPPVTPRTLFLLTRDGLKAGWRSLKSWAWWLASVATCGRVKRHRRPQARSFGNGGEGSNNAARLGSAKVHPDPGPSSPLALGGEKNGSSSSSSSGRGERRKEEGRSGKLVVVDLENDSVNDGCLGMLSSATDLARKTLREKGFVREKGGVLSTRKEARL